MRQNILIPVTISQNTQNTDPLLLREKYPIKTKTIVGLDWRTGGLIEKLAINLEPRKQQLEVEICWHGSYWPVSPDRQYSNLEIF